VICALIAGAIGCGSGGDETGGNPKQELRQWYAGVKNSVSKMERKQRAFTQFRVSRPPAESELVRLSPAGARAGETARGAANRLDAATSLTGEEAAGLYCYFFAFYTDLESSPVEKEFEVVIFNLVKTRLLPSASPTEVHESAAALLESMLQAERTKDPGTEVAAGVLC
jgi:hypothetical protein